MRITHLLTGAALAFAAPALAQTTPPNPRPTPAPGTSTMPTPAPTAAPMPDSTAMPQPTVTANPAPPAGASTTAPMGAPASAPSGTTPPATVTAPVTPVEPTVGATVYGAAGAPVGTIKAMDAQYVTLTTEKGEVKLPRAGVGPGLKGPVIGLTAAQLDAAVTQAQAAPGTTETKTTTTTSKTNTTKRR